MNASYNYLPGPSKGCQMDGSWGAIRQPLKVKTCTVRAGSVVVWIIDVGETKTGKFE